MRVLFATDGSRSADRARDLISGLRWPDDTRFLVVSAAESQPELNRAWFGAAIDPNDVDEPIRHADVTLDDAERTLTATGRPVERLRLREPAGHAIVDEARAWGADLVVVGSRGRGAVASAVLGSVSTEVVDRAPCSVLVVRSDRIASIVLAEDGSVGAALATEALLAWPAIRAGRVEVATVVEPVVGLSAAPMAGLYEDALGVAARDAESAREAAREVADRTAERLGSSGIPATSVLLSGNPGQALADHLETRPNALVVLGTRGHRGLAAVMLGSVARTVLHHAPGSVLVVRPAPALARPEPALAGVGGRPG